MAASVSASAGNGVSQTPTNRNRRVSFPQNELHLVTLQNLSNMLLFQGSSNVLFSGLINQKRNSVDEAAQARRASFNNMTPPPGFFGRMWNK